MVIEEDHAVSEDANANDAERQERAEEQDAEFSAVHVLADRDDADVFVISGNIDYILSDRLIDAIGSTEQRRRNAAVLLCTFGGDADAAYIIARTLQKAYTRTTLYISGFCKSAGTLIALGVDKIVMGSKGELGPLDVQLRIDDSFYFTFTSGLGSAKSIEYLQSKASDSFWDSFTRLTKVSERSFTAQTTANIAKDLVVGLLAPIAGQIDPLRLAENQRALDVAKRYGLRLAAEGLQASEENIDKLVYGYPSHRQVIDLDEAKEIFGEDRVRPVDELERMVTFEAMIYMLKDRGRESLRLPIGANMGENAVAHLNPVEDFTAAEDDTYEDDVEVDSVEKEENEREFTDDGERESEATAD